MNISVGQMVYIGNGRLITKASNGYLYAFAADDMSVGLHMLLQHQHEPYYASIWPKCLNMGDSVAVVGSNIGYHDIPIAKIVGPPGLVWSFEPNPMVVDLFKKNILLNGATNVRHMNKAVSDKVGPVCFNILHQDYGGCGLHLIDPNVSKLEQRVQVDSTTINAFFANIKLDVLKVDAEGSEAAILRGASDLKGRLRLVFLENNPDYYSEDYDVVVKEWRDAGYKLWVLEETGARYSTENRVRDLPICDFLLEKV